MAPAYMGGAGASLHCMLNGEREDMMRSSYRTILAGGLLMLALGACKDNSVNGTPSGAGNSESGASGGSAAAPGGERGNTGASSDTPAAAAPGTTTDGAAGNAGAGTSTATGGNPNATDRPVTPPADGKTNTTR